MRLLILNGPNLNLLGRRETHIYGSASMESCMEDLRAAHPGMELIYRQSNCEGVLIDLLQEYGYGAVDGIVLNAGGYTHTSVALADAIAAIEVPVVEVHVSQPAAREEFRHRSLIAGVCAGSIAGFGLGSYVLAVDWFVNIRKTRL